MCSIIVEIDDDVVLAASARCFVVAILKILSSFKLPFTMSTTAASTLRLRMDLFT